MHYGKTAQPEPLWQCVKCKTEHCCHSQSIRLTACNTGVSFATDNRSNVCTTTNIVKHLIQTSMKKNLSSQSMDAALQDFLGNPSLPTRRNRQVKLYKEKQMKPCRNRRTKLRRWYAALAASNVGHRWRSTRKNFSAYRPLKTASPCSSAAARAMPSTALSACSASDG